MAPQPNRLSVGQRGIEQHQQQNLHCCCCYGCCCIENENNMLDPNPAVGGSVEDAQSVISDGSSAASSCEENRIKVVCRVRPPVSRETQGRATLASSNRCVEVGADRRTVTLNSKPQGKSFTFDYAAGEDSTQEELFAEVIKKARAG